MVYLRTARYSEAVGEFEKSVSIEPNPRGYTNLGSAYYYLKRYADAVTPYQQAVKLADTNSTYWGNLADAYRCTEDLRNEAPAAFRRAIDLLAKEIQVDPKNPRLRAHIARYDVSSNERRQALAQIAEALRLDASQAYVQFRAALVNEQVGDHEGALKALESALKAGQPLADVLASPPLERLRKDPRFARMAGPRP